MEFHWSLVLILVFICYFLKRFNNLKFCWPVVHIRCFFMWTYGVNKHILDLNSWTSPGVGFSGLSECKIKVDSWHLCSIYIFSYTWLKSTTLSFILSFIKGHILRYLYKNSKNKSNLRTKIIVVTCGVILCSLLIILNTRLYTQKRY